MSHTHDRAAQSSALRLVLIVNAAYLLVEVIGGLAFGSLALLADAAHMFSDVAGLGIALAAHRLIERPNSTNHTYGMQRAEVIGAQVNGLVLAAAAAWVFIEAARRLGDAVEVEGAGLMIVASIGLVINLVSAWVLARNRGGSLNMQGAYLHMILDAIGSVGALVAGLAVIVADAGWVDPAVSVGIGALVLWAGWNLIRETTHVLMEGAPRHLDAGEIEAAIGDDPAVSGVHHLHLWSLASDTPALSAHVVLEGDRSLHEAQEESKRIEVMLHDRFGIDHATLQIECHPCDEAS